MSLTRMLRLAIVVAVVMACGPDSVAPIRGFIYSAATFQCGPADGPATAIYLAPNPLASGVPSGPFVQVYVPVSLDQLSGHLWTVSEKNSEAAAWFHSITVDNAMATTGYMIVSSVGADKTIEGSVDLQFPDVGRIKTGFRAKWTQGTVLCN